jgi:glycosyltransferase involved in cell wall biosynthesis
MAMSITVSLCLIVRDEADNLPRCLRSVRGLVEDLVVVDTGSQDDTPTIAHRFGARLFDLPWRDDFAYARNYAFAQARADYIWWLDADDVILPEHRERFRRLKANLDPSVPGVTMTYHYALDDHGNPALHLRLLRLVRRDAGFRWVGRIHETLEGPGPWHDSDVVVTHTRTHPHTERNLRIYRRMQDEGVPFTPRDLVHYANELAAAERWEDAVAVYHQLLARDDVSRDDRLWALRRVAAVEERRAHYSAVLDAVAQTFALSAPRAEDLCHLGYAALMERDFERAAAWYELATRVPRPNDMSPVEEPYWTWVPHLQLTFCYARLGRLDEACRHNEIAARWRPRDPHVETNRQVFRARGLDPNHFQPRPNQLPD